MLWPLTSSQLLKCHLDISSPPKSTATTRALINLLFIIHFFLCVGVPRDQPFAQCEKPLFTNDFFLLTQCIEGSRHLSHFLSRLSCQQRIRRLSWQLMPVKVVGSLIKSVSNPSRILQSVTYYVKLDPAAVDFFFRKKNLPCKLLEKTFCFAAKHKTKK